MPNYRGRVTDPLAFLPAGSLGAPFGPATPPLPLPPEAVRGAEAEVAVPKRWGQIPIHVGVY
jgi:hypothetical protein